MLFESQRHLPYDVLPARLTAAPAPLILTKNFRIDPMTEAILLQRQWEKPAFLTWGTKIGNRLEISRLQVLTAAITLVFCLAVSGALAFLVDSSNSNATEKQRTEAKNLAHSLDMHLTAALQLADHTLKQGRVEWLETHRLKDHRAFYESFPNFKNMIIQVAIIDATGILRATSLAQRPEAIDLSDREHFKAHVGTTADTLFISHPVIGRVSKRSTVQFSRPVFTSTGAFDGVIVASVDTSIFDNFFGNSYQERVSFGVIGQDGLTRFWYGTPAVVPQQALSRADAVAPARDALQGHFITPATASQPATIWYGKPPSPAFPLHVVVGINQSSLLKQIRATQMLGLALAMFLLLSACVAAGYMIKGIRAKNRVLRALQESQLKANSASAMKSRFVADISHELRTPLNGILGFSDLISKSTNISKTMYYGQLINSSAKHLHQLVNTMMDLAKIEAGKMEITRTACNLREVCDSVAGIHRYAAEKNEILLSVDYAEHLPKMIYTDRIKLMQILNNLLHNAVKFTVKGCVFLHVAQSRGAWQFKIADSGIGMTPAQLDQLFDRFSASAGDAQSNGREQGSGLGMALCKDLVELLGGNIHASSTPGVGTMVEVTLPIDQESDRGTPA